MTNPKKSVKSIPELIIWISLNIAQIILWLKNGTRSANDVFSLQQVIQAVIDRRPVTVIIDKDTRENFLRSTGRTKPHLIAQEIADRIGPLFDYCLQVIEDAGTLVTPKGGSPTFYRIEEGGCPPDLQRTIVIVFSIDTTDSLHCSISKYLDPDGVNDVRLAIQELIQNSKIPSVIIGVGDTSWGSDLR